MAVVWVLFGCIGVKGVSGLGWLGGCCLVAWQHGKDVRLGFSSGVGCCGFPILQVRDTLAKISHELSLIVEQNSARPLLGTRVAL